MRVSEEKCENEYALNCSRRETRSGAAHTPARASPIRPFVIFDTNRTARACRSHSHSIAIVIFPKYAYSSLKKFPVCVRLITINNMNIPWNLKLNFYIARVLRNLIGRPKKFVSSSVFTFSRCNNDPYIYETQCLINWWFLNSNLSNTLNVRLVFNIYLKLSYIFLKNFDIPNNG